MTYRLVCVPALDGVPVAPCGSVGSVALVPTVEPVSPFNPSSGPDLFVWSFSLAGGLFAVGLVIGSILKVIRSA